MVVPAASMWSRAWPGSCRGVTRTLGDRAVTAAPLLVAARVRTYVPIGGRATAITPAAGFVGPGASIIIGALASAVCFTAVGLVKNGFKIDDSLDVVAVHGVGGILGTLMLALFISEGFGGTGYGEGMAFGSQFVAQLIGVGAVAIWSAVATAIIGFGISFILPMRVSEDDERDGLDISNHGERAWDLD